MSQFKRLIASIVIFATALMGLPMQAQAAIVSTDTAMQSAESTAQRERVTEFLLRGDVQKELQAHGLAADQAVERVAAMSDAEVAQLAGRIDQAPAGGEILGILFTIFIILLITDILGLTKVFPFTRSVR
ncbi:MAG: PA2779 family protein [Burkholderiales bacterium]|nr:PA2779 family protein [Burkholderiales bacterium]